MIKVKVVGCGGYGGVGIVELLLRHPEAKIQTLVAATETGMPMSDALSAPEGILRPADPEARRSGRAGARRRGVLLDARRRRHGAGPRRTGEGRARHRLQRRLPLQQRRRLRRICPPHRARSRPQGAGAAAADRLRPARTEPQGLREGPAPRRQSRLLRDELPDRPRPGRGGEARGFLEPDLRLQDGRVGRGQEGGARAPLSGALRQHGRVPPQRPPARDGNRADARRDWRASPCR